MFFLPFVPTVINLFLVSDLALAGSNQAPAAPPPAPPAAFTFVPRADYATCDAQPLSTVDPAQSGNHDLSAWTVTEASRCSAVTSCTFNPCDCCYSFNPTPIESPAIPTSSLPPVETSPPAASTTSLPPAAPVVVDPFTQSEVLFTPETAPVCRGRCLSGVTDFLKHGLGFASVVFKFGEGLVEGAVDSVVGAVEGVWSIVSDPKDFVVNIVHAGENPKETALAIANAVSNYCTNDGNTTAESVGKCIGNAAGQIGMLFIGVGEAKEASIVAKGAEVCPSLHSWTKEPL